MRNLALVLVAFLVSCSNEANSQTVKQENSYIVDANFLMEKKDNPNVFIVDVRTPQEHAQGYIPGTDMNIPHMQIDRIKEYQIDPEKDTIVVYCRSGRRASIAYDALKKMGYRNVFLYKGSMLDWTSRNLPVENAR